MTNNEPYFINVFYPAFFRAFAALRRRAPCARRASNFQPALNTSCFAGGLFPISLVHSILCSPWHSQNSLPVTTIDALFGTYPSGCPST
jgi:hypothetical protein